jgi:hypothetical protein
MKTHKTQFLTILAALVAAAVHATAQYVCTTLTDPSGPTEAQGISSTNIVGGYFLNTGNERGYIYDGSAWTTLIAPGAGSGNNQGTQPYRVSGTDIVGFYFDSHTVSHGFVYNIVTRSWTILTNPLAGAASGQGTFADGMSGSIISGTYTDNTGVLHGYLYNIDSNTWTTVDDPLAGSGAGQGTTAQDISGTNIVGWYEDESGNDHGYLYNGSIFTNLDNPNVGTFALGTQAYGISGSNIVGFYLDGSGIAHGFIYNILTGAWTTLDDPDAGSGFEQGTALRDISGNNVVGSYWDSNGDVHGFLATPIPQLTLTQSGNNLNISWPYWNNPSTGWTLQQNSDLTTTNWTPTPTNAISNDGTNNLITITPTTGNLFFRLSQQ